MFEFVSQHQFGIAAAAYWIFSAAVSSLPDPSPHGSAGYVWLYRFCHTTAGNITTVFGSRIPGMKLLLAMLFAPLLLSTTACAARYTIHPRALNTTDSVAYDTLLIAETGQKTRVDRAYLRPDHTGGYLYDRPQMNHGAGSNAGFVDGHVQWYGDSRWDSNSFKAIP